MNKYAINPEEDEILPNLLGVTDPNEIAVLEYEGFLYAEILLNNELEESTVFDIDYIRRIHRLWL